MRRLPRPQPYIRKPGPTLSALLFQWLFVCQAKNVDGLGEQFKIFRKEIYLT